MKIYYLLLIITVIFVFSTCNANGKNLSQKEFLSKDASYALGMGYGTSLKTDNLYPDMDAFISGFKAVLNDENTRFTMEEAQQILNDEFSNIIEIRQSRNRQAEIEFLEKNRNKPGVMVTESGLQYEVMIEGNGPRPILSDIVKTHYEASLMDGTVFASTFSNTEPSIDHIDQFIEGFTEGLLLMNAGSKYRLVLPSELAYGEYGRGSEIPPYSPLIFEVELFSIEDENAYPHYHNHDDHDGHSH